MRRAFEIEQGIEVIKDGKVFDLHNDYVPRAIVVDARNNVLRILFDKLSGDDAGKYCALVFHDVDVLEFYGNLGASGMAGLQEIGYKGFNDYDYEWLSGEEQSEPDDHLVIRFDGGATLRVHSAKADFVDAKTRVSLE